tara:strand:+ start:2802 stop:3662 length:861 start_codon:yes stop_codon:yes gene_type:complete
MKYYKGIICLILIIINTLFWCVFLLSLALLKLIIPIESSKILFTKLIITVGEYWIFCNDLWIKYLHKPSWDVYGFEKLDKESWYIGISNHQSWADIFILQSITNRNIPMLKFFMKDILIWVPVIGLAWWALDMPFLKRYSKEKLEKNPELRGKDIKAMEKSFSRFSRYPVSIFIFAEGTRFTEEKKSYQNSKYKNLLEPKTGGLGLTLSTMPYIEQLIDFTIVYDCKRKSFWDFLCGNMSKARVYVDTINIPKHLKGRDYLEDKEYREEFKVWINAIWKKKDSLFS